MQPPDFSKLSRHRLRFAQALDLGKQPDQGIHVVRADGRGTHLQIPPGWTSLLIPLAGSLEVTSPWCSWLARPGEMLVWNDGALHASSYASSWWLVIAGPTDRWASNSADSRRAHADLLSRQGPHRRELKRLAVRLARNSHRPGAETAQLLGVLIALLHEEQRPTSEDWLSRCSGRTMARRQQSLVRLLRVERIIRSNPESRLDLTRLARMANYSPHHLIRVYRNVFGETPAEHALRLRTQHAWNLVRATDMPICEITEMLGFESQSAFCRAFKNSFGMTTSQVRKSTAPRPSAWSGASSMRPRYEDLAA